MRNDITTKIRTIIAENVAATSFTDDSALSELGIDSLTTIEVVMRIENEFGIAIELSDVSKGKFSLNTLSSIVEAKLGS